MRLSNRLLAVSLIIGAGVLGFVVSLGVNRSKHGGSSPELARVYHYPYSFVKNLKSDPLAGEKIYKEFCAACHAKHHVIPLRAPRVGITSDWQFIRKIPVKQLVAITSSGIGPMPARGGCFECSDQLLRKTILYMLDKSQ